MTSSLRTTFIAVFTLLLLSPLAYAQDEKLRYIPLPPGELTITNGYSIDPDQSHAHPTSKNGNKNYSLDLQPLRPDCNFIGAPILAAQGGKVISSKRFDKHITLEESKSYPENKTLDFFGTHVAIQQDDGSVIYYAHMIADSVMLDPSGFNNPKQTWKNDERIETGQILGLMGATGLTDGKDCTRSVRGQNKTFTAAHLHFERRTSLAAGTGISPEPLQGQESYTNLIAGKKMISTTEPLDPHGRSKAFEGVYPFPLDTTQIHGITPLTLTPGTKTNLVLTGKNLTDSIRLDLPFCNKTPPNPNTSNEQKIFTCDIPSDLSQKIDGRLNKGENKYLDFDFSLSNITPPKESVPRISDIRFRTARPGDRMEFEIVGENLTGDLSLAIYEKGNLKKIDFACETDNRFTLRTLTRQKASCKLPFDLPDAKLENGLATFSLKAYDNKMKKEGVMSPRYSTTFQIDYGIRIDSFTPRRVNYFETTTFTLKGKNVNLIQAKSIENCRNMQTIPKGYDELLITCDLHPDYRDFPENLEGDALENAKKDLAEKKPASHRFFFKRLSKYLPDGSIRPEANDRENEIISGYITGSYQPNPVVDSITPDVAIIDTPTLFSIEGRGLKYTDTSDREALIWIELCSTDNEDNKIEILPETFSPQGFSFTCTPRFNDEEFKVNEELQARYEIPGEDEKSTQQLKQSLWPDFDDFFMNHEVKLENGEVQKLQRRVLVKDAERAAALDPNRPKTDKKSLTVQVYSSLYAKDILGKEKVEFKYTVDEGSFVSGDPKVTSVNVTQSESESREYTLEIKGEYLPKDLEIVSSNCNYIHITYKSSARYSAICVLKETPKLTVQINDPTLSKTLKTFSSNIYEVYDVSAKRDAQDPLKAFITVKGVNLEAPIVSIRGNECEVMDEIGALSGSERKFECHLVGDASAPPEVIQMEVSRNENPTTSFVFFEALVRIK